jgi:hypothetical protein
MIISNENSDVERKRTSIEKDDIKRPTTRLGKGGKYKNTTISINPSVVSWTLSAVQSFDSEHKRQHQTTATPYETREGGGI